MMQVPISPGELIDKITILEIKQQRLHHPEKLENVTRELALLKTVLRKEVLPLPEISALTLKLRAINEALWDIEDAIRECERQENFGDAFIDLARSVYRKNDERSGVKRDINRLLDADIIEEKSYAEY